MAQDGEEWCDDERYYSSGRDSDDSPLLSQRTHEKRGYSEYPPAKEERERRSTLSLLMKFFLFSTAMITFCVLLYIPVYNRANYQMSKALVAGWSTHTNRDTKLYVLPNNVTVVHEPTNICDKNDQKNKLFLLIIVCSATDNFDRRLAIRNTWGNYKKFIELSQIFNTVRDRYKDYNFTYDLYNISRVKRDVGIADLLPELAKALQSNLAGNKTDSVPETRFQEDTFQDFENKDQNDYNNYDYESNIMKIPPNGYEDNPDLDKVMSMLKKDKSFPKAEEVVEDSDTEVDFKLAFLLGLPVQNDSSIQDKIDEEVVKYRDIIQEGFLDSYNNLTLKSIMMLKWINNNCNESVRYILKTDDDMYINVPNLVANLRNRSRAFDRASGGARQYLLIGDLICGARPVLDSTNKWYSPRYMYRGRVYPRYLSGSGYALSAPAAAALYAAALRTPYFHLEDIYITGICAARATPRVPPADDPTFSYSPAGAGGAGGGACGAHARATSHRVAPPLMRAFVRALADQTVVDKCERIRLTQVRRDRMRPKTQPKRQNKRFHVH